MICSYLCVGIGISISISNINFCNYHSLLVVAVVVVVVVVVAVVVVAIAAVLAVVALEELDCHIQDLWFWFRFPLCRQHIFFVVWLRVLVPG